MARHLVCLSVDFDGITSWVNRGLAGPGGISRGEFGVIGNQRLLALFDKCQIEGTWFIPAQVIETYPEQCKRIHAEGHEIGHHGDAHEAPATLSRAQEEAVLVRGKEVICELTGSYPRGYRSPSWELSYDSVELLVKHGFVYDSSLMGHDYMPYRARQGDIVVRGKVPQFGQASRLIEMPISWARDDAPHLQYLRMPSYVSQGLKRTADVLENWLDDFRYFVETEEWGVLTYTLHSHVIGQGYCMVMLDTLVRELRNLGAIFVRMDTATEEFAQRWPA